MNSRLTKEAERRAGKPDISSLAGLFVAAIGILGGLLLEGGKFSDLGQFTAAMIVLGGTAGAVMVTTPLPLLVCSCQKIAACVLGFDDFQQFDH